MMMIYTFVSVVGIAVEVVLAAIKPSQLPDRPNDDAVEKNKSFLL